MYLKLQSYRQTLVAIKRNQKLSAKYYGPFEVEQKVRTVAYKLKLPAKSQIHPVFHVSMLKQAPKEAPIETVLSQVDQEGMILVAPPTIKDQRLIQRKGQQVKQVLGLVFNRF